MRNTLSKIFHAMAAGATGGMLQSGIILLVGKLGFFNLLGLPLSFDFNLVWFYQRITWGGLWGLLFLVPLLGRVPHWQRGVAVGVFPALATSLLFLPFKDVHGWFGLNLGAMMPVVVFVFGILWGVISGALLDLVREPSEAAD